MATATFEEAQRCPKCNNPGEIEENHRRGPNNSTIHLIWCRNPVCLWYNTNWVVQQMSDGTVPVRASQAEEPRREKTFPKLPGRKDNYMKGLERDDDERLPPDSTSTQS